jgi:hypothetical protein
MGQGFSIRTRVGLLAGNSGIGFVSLPLRVIRNAVSSEIRP